MDKDKFLQNLKSANMLRQNSNVSYCKLMESGVELPSHVSNRLPNAYLVIKCLEADFFEAIQHLNKQDVIGLSLEGCDIGRSGSLEWLNISSSTCTYLFYVASLGGDAFDKGLKMLLENKRIVKVIHDCRRASDCFYHQYNTKPSNVFDTQVADFVVNAIKKKAESITNKVNSLNYCLNLYLNVPKEYLCKHFNSSLKLSSLPLNPNLLQFLIKNVIYLRMLKQELDIILRMPFRRCIDVYLNVILKKDDHELQLYPTDFKLLPPELVMENMQIFKFTDKLKPADSSKPQNNEDPFARYERDCRKYQQKYGYGKYAADKELEIDDNCENVDSGWSYSNRNEIIQFLLDKMFSGDNCDRSVISMSPFENLSDRDDCSVTLERDMCNTNFEHDFKHESKAASVPNFTSKSSYLSETKLSPSSKSLKSPEKFAQPFENLSSSSDGSRSQDLNTPVVDNNLSNVLAFPNTIKPSSLNATESLSSGSSFSKKSQVYKKLAEQRHLLTNQKQLSSKSAFLGKDSIGVEKLLFSKKNSNDGKDSVCDNSSLSGKSQVYKKFAEEKCLLSSQEHVLSKSAISGKDSMNIMHSAGGMSNFVKESLSDDSSDISSLSRKSQLTYKLFAEQKRLLNHQARLSNVSIINPDKGPICAEGNSLPNSNIQPSVPLKEASQSAYREDNSSKSSFGSINGSSDFLKDKDSLKIKSFDEIDDISCDLDSLNSCQVDENNLPTCVQDEDPWARLRDAFSELGPARYSSEKVVFVPAGMQY
ncbi:uncharacterized protein [Parasteatoda tepidariorum]|uniref:uncharacterized protein n=1 Tax=Parasteatoda tepidariorum TaxID=114398 RepID=UPI0039BCB82F